MSKHAVEVSVCSSRFNREDIAPAYREMWERLADIFSQTDAQAQGSDAARINSAAGEAVVVSDDMYRLIAEAVMISGLTRGVFDITVKPLKRLQERLKTDRRLPSPDETQEMLEVVDYKNIQMISGNRIRLLDSRAALDPETVAAGYAADQALKIMRSHGFYNIYIDMGLKIYAGGTTCGGGLWRVGIPDAVLADGTTDVVYLSDAAMATSGHPGDFFEIDGVRYSAVMDPRTAVPLSSVVSATVIAPTAMVADALSAALRVMDPQEGLKLIDKLGRGYAATLVKQNPDGSLERMASRRYDDFHAVYKPLPPSSR